MGNICRSPALAAAFRALAVKRGVENQFYVDSAALTTFYLGQSADLRMCKAAKKKGIAIEHISRLFEKSDFSKFDYILAVNHEVKDLLEGLASSEKEKQKILLATAYAKRYTDEEILDPYYQGKEAFDHVMDMAMDACEGLIQELLAL